MGSPISDTDLLLSHFCKQKCSAVVRSISAPRAGRCPVALRSASLRLGVSALRAGRCPVALRSASLQLGVLFPITQGRDGVVSDTDCFFRISANIAFRFLTPRAGRFLRRNTRASSLRAPVCPAPRAGRSLRRNTRVSSLRAAVCTVRPSAAPVFSLCSRAALPRVLDAPAAPDDRARESAPRHRFHARSAPRHAQGVLCTEIPALLFCASQSAPRPARGVLCAEIPTLLLCAPRSALRPARGVLRTIACAPRSALCPARGVLYAEIPALFLCALRSAPHPVRCARLFPLFARPALPRA